MNYAMARKERISKLENKISRVTTALKTYPYTNPKDYMDDVGALEGFEKEIQIQLAYSQLESNLH